MTFPQFFRFVVDQAIRFFSPPGVAFEWVLVFTGALIVVVFSRLLHKQLKKVRSVYLELANRKWLCIAICGVLPIAIRLSMLPFDPIPEPSIHDEFSHLLLADTVAHGRLSNPTHPMWEHFESIHIIQRPTYNSMYPPGQGAFLALGQKLFHEPWVGVLLGVGCMCAALCWMLQQWLPPGWAFLGALLVILKFAVVGFWMDSYMGGSVSAVGGALLIGSVPALRRNLRAVPAFVFVGGLVFLMNTRPFEGGILGACAGLWIFAQRKTLALLRNPSAILRVVGPALALLLLAVSFEGYYFWRVTGSPTLMPYQVNRNTYGWPENLSFLPAKHLVLRHKVMQDMYDKEIAHHAILKTPFAFFDNLVTKIFDNWIYFFGPTLSAPLLFLPFVIRDKRTRPLAFFAGVIFLVNLFQMVLYPYHLGPVIPILFALLMQGARHMYVTLSRANRASALLTVALLPVGLLSIGAIKEEATELAFPLSSYWERGYEWHRDARASIEAWLKGRAEKQLVIVRYSPDHPVNQEWVYNGADIDGSHVVWAREMSIGENSRLLKYFPHREIWLLNADVYPQRLIPYCGCRNGKAANISPCESLEEEASEPQPGS